MKKDLAAARERVVHAIALLKQSGVTNTEVAQRIGASKTRISKWKSGKENPTLENVILLCKNYGVDPEIIILGHPKVKTEELLMRIDRRKKPPKSK